MATDESQKKLSVREQMTIHILIMLIRVIKPMDWANDLDFKEIIECMKKGA